MPKVLVLSTFRAENRLPFFLKVLQKVRHGQNQQRETLPRSATDSTRPRVTGLIVRKLRESFS